MGKKNKNRSRDLNDETSISPESKQSKIDKGVRGILSLLELSLEVWVLLGGDVLSLSEMSSLYQRDVINSVNQNENDYSRKVYIANHN